MSQAFVKKIMTDYNKKLCSALAVSIHIFLLNTKNTKKCKNHFYKIIYSSTFFNFFYNFFYVYADKQNWPEKFKTKRFIKRHMRSRDKIIDILYYMDKLSDI